MRFLDSPKIKEQEINWDVPMWVQDIEDPTVIVLTDGHHNEKFFTGTGMPHKEFPNGYMSEMWVKSAYKPVTGTIMFPISNDN